MHESGATRPNANLRERQRRRWKRQAQAIEREVLVAWFILKDRRTPWYARAVAAVVVGYVLSPVQLIPSFIPVIGFLDDFLVAGAGIRLIRWLTASNVLIGARRKAHITVLAGNHDSQPQLIRGTIAVIVCVWLLLTVAAFLWLVRR